MPKPLGMSDFDPILELWKGREDEELQFCDIKDALEPEGWNERRILRYLSRMVRWGILTKRKSGSKGARAFYQTTDKAHAYGMYQFFQRVRNHSYEEDQVMKVRDAFTVFGIPKQETLTALEQKILTHFLFRMDDAFSNLHMLRESIVARMEQNQPTDDNLVLNFLFSSVSESFKSELQHAVYRSENEQEIRSLIDIAKSWNLWFDDPTPYFEVEDQWLDPERPVYKIKPYRSFEASCLAAMMLVSPDLMEEYALNSFNHVKRVVEHLVQDKKTLSDRDLLLLAKAFVKREQHPDSFVVKTRIKGLKSWPWLRITIGGGNALKLAKIAYYLWEQRQNRDKIRRTEQPTKTAKKITVVFQKKDPETEKILEAIKKIRF